MKKELLINIEAFVTVEVNIPDHLLEELEDTYRLTPYKKTSEGYKPDELYEIINEQISRMDLDWEEIEILEIKECEN
jgi:hypothetical protein